ncbi:MAG: rod shape-determining protein RodA [Asticcacaulis sp.]
MTSSAISRPGERDRWQTKVKQIDWGFALLITLIAMIGALMLYSVAGMSWSPWAYNHLFRYGFFFIIMIGLALVDLRVWFALSYPVYALGLFLLVLVELFGDVRLGAQRWLDLGFISFQPSEIMKIGIVMALARWYHGADKRAAHFSVQLLVPMMMIALPVALVAHQPDLGTSLLILMSGLAIVFVAGLSWKVIVPTVVGVLALIPVMVQFVLHDYQRKRVMTFLNPEQDVSGDGYQILQSKIAMGSGGLLGKGLGLGSQSQLQFLPEKHTDFIMAAVAEELGFVGSFAILCLYALIIAMALRIGTLSHSHFGRLAVVGATSTFALYVLINGAMVMGMAPVVGVPMPLLSNGGTVMLTVMIGFGLIMGVRVHRYDELPSGRGQLW